MSLRPKRAQWFEVVVRKDDCSASTEALAATAQVQFECRGERSAKQLLAELSEPLENYRTLLPAYKDWWPEPVFDDRCCVLPMESSAKFAMERLLLWQRRAQLKLDRLRAFQADRQELLVWQQILDGLSDSQLDFGALSDSGPLLTRLCLLLPSGSDPSSFGQLLSVTVPLQDQRAILAVVHQPEADSLCRQAEALHGRCSPIPKWLEGSARQSRQRLEERLGALEWELDQTTSALRKLAEHTGVARALGTLQRLDWLTEHAHNLALTEDLCWITGWTTVADDGVLNRALAAVGVAASVDFLDAPAHVRPPSVFDNPAWARPFEIFTRAMGVPADDEADPSAWVAVLVPLMFGYMCGDVGHGLVIALAGLYLQRRWPMARLLVFCGISGIGFGLLYGDFFGLEDLLSPLWLRPLDDPLLTLAVPVAGGALVLTLGLLLNSVQLCWRTGPHMAWMADAAQLGVYWGIVLTFFEPMMILLSLLGVLGCAMHSLWTRRSAMAAVSTLGELVENTLQLFLNTLSFVRVGAFALAHAGLSSAVFALADGLASSAAHLSVLILGNLVIIVLEGLVVSIQATRLVLFEFFVRFFRGRGRAFEPTHSPPSVPRGQHHGH